MVRIARAIEESAAFLLWITGIPFLVRNVLARGRVGILLYHEPPPDVFERHLDYLTRHYSLIPFKDVVDAVDCGNWSSIPSRSLVIHIDDGYARNRALLGTLVRHPVRPTLYLCSHIVGTSRRFWSKLQGGQAKRLRLVENHHLLEKLHEEADFTPNKEYTGRQALSRDEITDLSGQVDFQSHGRYHFSLLTLDDDQLREELAASKTAVEQMTGRSCEHFSFPYGDYGEREVAAVRECGYRTARTTEPGWINARSDLYRLPILADVPGTISPNVLRAHLTGIPRLMKRLAYVSVTHHLHAIRLKRLMRRPFFGPEDAV